MYELETHVTHYDQGTIKIAIVPDEDPSPPSDSDCEPEFFHAQRGGDLYRKLKETFPTDAPYYTMVSGDPYKAPNGDWFFGFTEYRHGQSAFALCGSARARNFPDQQWDVIGLAGWIKVSRQNRIDWRIHGKRNVQEKARDNAIQSLKQWETYRNGGVCGFVVTAFDTDEKELDQDSCFGYYEQESALEDANAIADDLADRLGWKEENPLPCAT